MGNGMLFSSSYDLATKSLGNNTPVPRHKLKGFFCQAQNSTIKFPRLPTSQTDYFSVICIIIVPLQTVLPHHLIPLTQL